MHDMHVQQKLQYIIDAFLGDVDLGADLNHLLSTSEKCELANSPLCFSLTSAHYRIKIPIVFPHQRLFK